MPRNYAVLPLIWVIFLMLALPFTQPAVADSLLTPALPVARETLRIDGSEQMLTINQSLKQRYEKQYPEAEVELKARGTEPALKELLNNEIDLAAIGRSLTAAEKAQGLIEIPISREKIAIVVGQENPFQGRLTIGQLGKIFSGEITDWSEVGGAAGPIRVIDHPASSDTRLVLQQYPIFRDIEFASGENVVQLPNDDTTELLKELGDDGISYAIASQLVNQTQARIVKLAITLDVLPDDSYYPYSQLRSYVYKPEPSSTAQAFLGFATTKPGQAAVAAAKLSEAEAVAVGRPVIPVADAVPDAKVPGAKVLPVSQVNQPIAVADSPTDDLGSDSLGDSLNDRFRQVRFWWIVLPLVGLGLLLRWITQRFRSQAAQPAIAQTEAVPPVSPAAKSSPRAETRTAITPSLEVSLVNPTVEPVEPTDELSASAVESTAPTEAAEEMTAESLEPTVEAEQSAKTAIELESELDSELESELETAPEQITEPITESIIIAEPVTEADLAEMTEVEITTAELIDDNLVESGEPNDLSQEPLAVAAELTAASTTAEIKLPPLSPSALAFQQNYLDSLTYQGKTIETATVLERYTALATLMCQRLLSLRTPDQLDQNTRLIGEIAAEFLPGPHLENSLINLGLLTDATQAMQHLGLDIKQLFAQEEEPGLGTGGLGRLMVCYLDALATADRAAIGYGIRYEYGIFDQEIDDGWQVEVNDTWLRYGNPWEVERLDKSVDVQFGGSTEAYIDDQGRYRVRWLATETIRAIPYDTPIPGYHSETVNLLRLWRAESSDLCKVLYPVDVDLAGKALRLKQQFFLVSCALQDALRLRLNSEQPDSGQTPDELEKLPDRLALQINDTDPTIAIAELMRLLIDQHNLAWERAWQVTQQTFSYTNHSLMPETLDDLWTVGIFGHFLPRHLEIIYEINYRLLETVKTKYPNDLARLNRMSLIDERSDRYIRLNNLACVGSHAVNGVSQLHTQLLEQTILHDFYDLYPDKFKSITNGVTPRRFLLQANPQLAALISSKLGDGWVTNLQELSGLEAYANDPYFQSQWLQIKQTAKQNLATQIWQQTAIEVDPNSLFDVQAMVIHEYKRQHLNLLHILTLYNRIKANPLLEMTPRTFIFAGKAAADYTTAKRIIKLIHAVAELVNNDADVRGRLKVVFLRDFNIKTAQPIYPAIDLAEHISTAGTEAADTGNMIAVLNGALLIGTPDGTNLEIRDAIGADNFFQFGLSVSEVRQRRVQGYNPLELYQANPELKGAIDLLTSSRLTSDTGLFRPLVDLLLHSDQYMLVADYADYLACQRRVAQVYRDTDRWTQMAILSTARSGQFSADRAVQDYCQEIWQIPSEPLPEHTQAKKSLS